MPNITCSKCKEENKYIPDDIAPNICVECQKNTIPAQELLDHQSFPFGRKRLIEAVYCTITN